MSRELSFIRKPHRQGNRLMISVPPDVAELLDPGVRYRVTLTSVGSLTPGPARFIATPAGTDSFRTFRNPAPDFHSTE